MDSSLPGSSVHGILQVRILEGVVIPFSRVSSQLKDRIQVSCISHRFFTCILAALNFVWSRSILFPHLLVFSCSVQFSSVAQSFLTLCNPMNCSTPGLLIHHKLPESTQTHVHWVSDALQPSRPLSSPSQPALNLSQHQGIFKWVCFLDQLAKFLEFQLQNQF